MIEKNCICNTCTNLDTTKKRCIILEHSNSTIYYCCDYKKIKKGDKNEMPKMRTR